MGAGGGEGGVITRNGIAVVFFGALHDALRHLRNFLHKCIALHFPLLNQRELVFPIAGKVWACELFHIKAAQ